MYLGQRCPYYIRVVFKYQERKYTSIPSNSFSFYKSEIGQKINTSKLILDPKYVRTNRRKYSFTASQPTRSINLVGESDSQTKEHNWYKQRLVKGTIALDNSLFPADTKPTEVPFIDGYSELKRVVNVTQEEIDPTLNSGIWSFTLLEISENNILDGSPGFAAVRSVTDVNAPTNQFSPENRIITTDPTNDLADGEWCFIVNTDGTCTVYIRTATLNTHTAEYQYTVNDPGIDRKGMHSIYYENGIIHFAEEISTAGIIEFETSTYTAFYNIAETIKDSEIKEVDIDSKTIIVSDSLATRLLKQSSAMKARPAYVRVIYDYFEESTESLVDLEPNFSPMCKDVDFRAVNSDILEEL